SADLKDERAHWRAARHAFDIWYRHFYNAAHGIAEVIALEWNPSTRPQELRHGATILFVGAILAVIPDAQDGNGAPVDGVLSLEQLDQTEPIPIDNGAAP